MAEALKCIKCDALLDAQVAPVSLASSEALELSCPGCGRLTQMEIFPALFREIETGRAGEKIVAPEEAACFYHPQKRASVPCDNCGRFLCALCDVELQGKHLCPSCIQAGRKKGKLRDLENERVLYDRIALTTAFAPLLFWPITVISAPATVYLCIRHWNDPGSIVRRSRVRYVIAMIFALLQIGGWLTVGYFVFRKAF